MTWIRHEHFQVYDDTWKIGKVTTHLVFYSEFHKKPVACLDQQVGALHAIEIKKILVFLEMIYYHKTYVKQPTQRAGIGH